MTSKYRNLLSKLGRAEELFQPNDFDASVDLFSEPLQNPKVRLQAARSFLDLCSFGYIPDPSKMLELLRLSFEALDMAKAHDEARTLGKKIRPVLTAAINCPTRFRFPRL